MRQFAIRHALLIFLLLIVLSSISVKKVIAGIDDTDRPHIFWIIAEDVSAEHIGAYGERSIETPNIDRMGEEGLLFKNAFVSTPVCSPARSAMVTGMHPTSSGTLHHRSQRDEGRGSGNVQFYDSYQLPSEIPFLPEVMQQAGYYTVMKGWDEGELGKSDFNFIWDRDHYDDHEWIGRDTDKPLFVQIQLRGGKDRGAQPENPADPSQVVLPPYYPSHPVIIDNWVGYLNSVMKMDEEVGEILDQIDRSGMTDNSLVIFITDHGISHLREKQFLYEGGIRVPLVVKWPGYVESGSVRKDLTYADLDITATIMNAAGIEIPGAVNGRDLLTDDYIKRDRVYNSSDRVDETLEMMRSVRTDKYKYIRNFRFFDPHIKYNRYKFSRDYTHAVLDLHEEGMLNKIQERFFREPRPVEELYNLEKDPYELYNLAEEPGYEDKLVELREELEDWMIRTGDMGLIPEPVLEEYGGQYGSKYAAMQTPELKNQIRQVLEMKKEGLKDGRPQELLSEFLDHEAESVRFWAATLLAQDQRLCSAYSAQLEALINDEVHVVRLAASDALMRIGKVEQGLEVISEKMEHENLKVRHYALLVAENHFDKVHPLESQIRELVEDPYEYNHRVAYRLLYLMHDRDITTITG